MPQPSTRKPLCEQRLFLALRPSAPASPVPRGRRAGRNTPGFASVYPNHPLSPMPPAPHTPAWSRAGRRVPSATHIRARATAAAPRSPSPRSRVPIPPVPSLSMCATALAVTPAIPASPKARTATALRALFVKSGFPAPRISMISARSKRPAGHCPPGPQNRCPTPRKVWPTPLLPPEMNGASNTPNNAARFKAIA